MSSNDFQAMYATNRNKETYQQAVDEALIDAHLLNPEDLQND
jgi:hypothetical protein